MKNYIFKKILKLLLEHLKSIDWQSVLFELYNSVVRPRLLKFVTKTTNKFDDEMFKGIDSLINTFINPDNIKDLVVAEEKKDEV